MAIKLKWVNPNAFATTIEIYRGDTPLDRTNLGVPVATLSNGETSWIDAAAAYDRVYYYVFVTIRGTDRVVGANNKVETVERKGAGPNNFRYGNDRLGYYGRLKPTEFINSGKILAALKSLVGISTPIIAPDWYKYARNGKTLYVPNMNFGNVAWDSLYKAGAVYGVDGFGGPHGSLPNTNQLVIVELNGDEYMVRLPLGVKNDAADNIDLSVFPKDEENANVIDMASAPYKTWRCEFNDLYYPMFHQMPNEQYLPNVRQLDSLSVIGSDSYPYNKFRGIACQEHLPAADFAIARGRSIYGSPNPRGINALSTAKAISTAEGRTPSNMHTTIWLPLLELVVPVNVSP